MTLPDGLRRPHTPAGTAHLEVEGIDGTVVFDGQVVMIKRVGKRDERLPLRSITALVWTPARGAHGSVRFTAETTASVHFSEAQQPSFELLRKAIETVI